LPAEGKPPRVARNVIFRDEAENDLTELALYIAGHSGRLSLTATSTASMRRVPGWRTFPSAARDDILPGLRTIGFERRATIVFRVLKTRVEIVSIAYGGRISSASCARANRGAGAFATRGVESCASSPLLSESDLWHERTAISVSREHLRHQPATAPFV